jgi:hypothetical protein
LGRLYPLYSLQPFSSRFIQISVSGPSFQSRTFRIEAGTPYTQLAHSVNSTSLNSVITVYQYTGPLVYLAHIIDRNTHHLHGGRRRINCWCSNLLSVGFHSLYFNVLQLILGFYSLYLKRCWKILVQSIAVHVKFLPTAFKETTASKQGSSAGETEDATSWILFIFLGRLRCEYY